MVAMKLLDFATLSPTYAGSNMVAMRLLDFATYAGYAGFFL